MTEKQFGDRANYALRSVPIKLTICATSSYIDRVVSRMKDVYFPVLFCVVSWSNWASTVSALSRCLECWVFLFNCQAITINAKCLNCSFCLHIYPMNKSKTSCVDASKFIEGIQWLLEDGFSRLGVDTCWGFIIKTYNSAIKVSSVIFISLFFFLQESCRLFFRQN